MVAGVIALEIAERESLAEGEMAMTFPQAGARETAVVEPLAAPGERAPAVDSRSPSAN
jgi:hypothetical protein